MNVYVGHWHTNSSPPPPPSLTIDPHSVTWTHQTPPHKKIPPIPIRPPHQLITTTLNYPKLEVAPKIPKPPSLIFLSKHCKKSDWRNCELWVGLHAGNGATLLVGIWWRENKNDLVEWKALVDTVRIKSADLKDDFYSRVLRLIELPVIGKGRKLPYLLHSSQTLSFMQWRLWFLRIIRGNVPVFWSINMVILFLSFKQATTAPNKLIDSQHYKRLRRKILIASHSLSHFTLTAKQLNLSFFKNFKLLQNNSVTGTVFSLISFKRDKNGLGNILVRGSFQTNDQPGAKLVRAVEWNDEDVSEAIARHLNLPYRSKQHMAVCGLSPHLDSSGSRKTLE